MASHDTEIRHRRAISQDNNAEVQMLNKELRKLKESSSRQISNKTEIKSADEKTSEPKS
jgi:hypothetical protein